MAGTSTEPVISAIPRLGDGNDVEHGQRRHSVRRIQRHALRDPASPVMTYNREARKAQPLHQRQHVRRERAFRIRRVVGRACGTAASPIAAQVGADDRMGLGQARGDVAPHQMRFGKAVQQQNRRPGSRATGEDLRGARVDLERCEALEHRTLNPAARRRRRSRRRDRDAPVPRPRSLPMAAGCCSCNASGDARRRIRP